MMQLTFFLLFAFVAHGFTVQQPCSSSLPRRMLRCDGIDAHAVHIPTFPETTLRKSHLFTSPRNHVELSRLKRAREKLVNFWYFTKRWLSRRKRFTVYVLECEHDKYYVGCTNNRRRRMQEHLSERGGSKWTRIHKPVRLAKEYRRIPSEYYLGKEAQVTAELMLKNGINNVRGAMFAEPRPYTRADIDALTAFLGHFNNLDYTELGAKLEVELEPAPWTTRSRRQKKKKRRKKATRSDRCFYCGEQGHWAHECPEKWGSLDD